MTITRRQFGRLAAVGAATGAGLASGLPMPALAQTKVLKMKLGTPFPTTHPGGSRMVEVGDLIRAETNGAVDISVFPNNQLGGESDMESQLRAGALDFMTTSGAVLQTFVPTAGINAVPFVFKDYTNVWPAMDGGLGEYIRGAIFKVGIYTFPKSLDNGFRNITTSSRPIVTPDDLKGLKIRVPVTPLWVSAFKALGASAATINLPELYSALQTRIVDGQENPMVQINAFRIYEVQKYCSLTAHVWDGNWIVANGRKWASLPDDVQKVISRNMDEITVKQRADILKMNTDLVAELAGKGLIFNTPEREPFHEALVKAGFYTDWKKKYGPEAWGALEKAVGTSLG
jgi:TRAP-type transport system periplasmic protein